MLSEQVGKHRRSPKLETVLQCGVHDLTTTTCTKCILLGVKPFQSDHKRGGVDTRVDKGISCYSGLFSSGDLHSTLRNLVVDFIGRICVSFVLRSREVRVEQCTRHTN